MFNIVSKKNNNRFEAVFMSNHFVLCSTFAMSEPIFHYIERFHSTKEGLLAAFNTTQPSLHFHRLTLPRCNYLVWLARICKKNRITQEDKESEVNKNNYLKVISQTYNQNHPLLSFLQGCDR